MLTTAAGNCHAELDRYAAEHPPRGLFCQPVRFILYRWLCSGIVIRSVAAVRVSLGVGITGPRYRYARISINQSDRLGAVAFLIVATNLLGVCCPGASISCATPVAAVKRWKKRGCDIVLALKCALGLFYGHLAMLTIIYWLQLWGISSTFNAVVSLQVRLSAFCCSLSLRPLPERCLQLLMLLLTHRGSQESCRHWCLRLSSSCFSWFAELFSFLTALSGDFASRCACVGVPDSRADVQPWQTVDRPARLGALCCCCFPVHLAFLVAQIIRFDCDAIFLPNLVVSRISSRFLPRLPRGDVLRQTEPTKSRP